MNVLIFSPVFYPSVGGLETVARMLAEGFTDFGLTVRVVTYTPGGGGDDRFPYEVIRGPSPFALLDQVRWCDVFFHQNISLKGLWPLVLCRRRFVVAHHGLYARNDGKRGWQAKLKILVSHFAENIAVSSFVAHDLGSECRVIPNPYQDDLFRLRPEVERDIDLVFAGRLVSEKGCDLLIAALVALKKSELRPRLTIVGNGDEESSLRIQVDALGLSDQVTFSGRLTHTELPVVLNRHKLLVVPSVVREGFGLVALEGIACGCGVIASDIGGLPEAVGPCGVLFQAGNAGALADCIAELLREPARIEAMRRNAGEHLAKHGRDRIVRLYLDALLMNSGNSSCCSD